MKYLKKYWGPLLLLIVVFGIRLTSNYNSKKEIICKVDEIEIAITGAIRVYENGEEVSFNRFTFYKTEDILVGDSLVKPKGSEYLYQYRFDEKSQSYKLIKKFHEN